MTYIPSVLSQIDNKNSTSGTFSSYVGDSVITTGYNKIVITINSSVNSNAGGLEIKFSDDNITFSTFYTNTYFSGVAFNKSFPILKKYYKISYVGTSSTYTTITTRLSTDTPEEKDESMNDAFNKLRVSMPYTLLDLKFPVNGTNEILSNSMMICNSKSGSYSSTYGGAKCILDGSGIGFFINQSRKYCTYQPGKSLLFMASGVLDAKNSVSSGYNTSGTKSRIGYYDSINGLFFEYTGNNYGNGTISVVLRNNSEDTTISQSNWNIDKMNGTGISGLNLNFTKAQLFVIDFEWLGVGRIRFGFYAMGKINYCHQITNINALSSPYMLTPNLPIRYELVGSDSEASCSLIQICGTVLSEGGYNPVGKPFSISNNTTSISINNTSEIPMLVIKKKTIYNHQNIIPTNINFILTGVNDIISYKVRLYLAPKSPGTITWSDVDSSNSLVQYSTTISSFSTANSIIVDEGYIAGRGSVTFGSLTNIFTNFLQLTSNIDNTSDVLVISAIACSSASTGYASLSWQEVY